jgi:UDP-N-acetylmuramoyl-tripeptide--D-alanyl-D-alanine ligase
MADLTLDYLLRHAGTATLAGEAPRDLTFTSITNHHREARPGSLFLAIEAARDGHEFIVGAQEAGAIGVLARRVVPEAVRPGFAYVLVDDPIVALQRVASARRRELEAGVIGITGSVGKTSTKEAVAQVLRRRFDVHASRGNYNNEIGLPITILDATDQNDRLVLEMGAYKPGDIASLCAIAEPQMGIVTTVGPTHLESFGSLEAIERAKGELVEALPETGLAVLNGDDERVRRMALRAACPVVTYGRGELCVVRATEIETRGLDGIAFTLRVPGGQARVLSPLIGAHSIYSCLAAAAVALADEMEPEEIAAALAEPPTRLRLRPLPGRNGATILDDSYNAAPISMQAALDVLAEHRGRRVAILGDMLELGEIEEEAHRRVGQHAAGSADVLYAVGPRGKWIGDEARRAGMDEVHLADEPAGVAYQPEAGDLILVKASRGMALERVVQRLVEVSG